MQTRTEMRPVKYHYADTFWCTYIVSVLSANIAETVTYPLDLTKTRLQIQGEMDNGGKTVKARPVSFKVDKIEMIRFECHAISAVAIKTSLLPTLKKNTLN